MTKSASTAVVRFYGTDELSNFHVLATPIVHDGREYPTSEHLYHALKYENAAMIELIRTASTPYKAKVLANGKPTKNAWQRALVAQAAAIGAQPRDDFDKLDAMETALRAKFTADRRSRDALLATGEAQLIEASPYDYFWGEGANRGGRNELGKLLERLRNEFRRATN